MFPSVILLLNYFPFTNAISFISGLIIEVYHTISYLAHYSQDLCPYSKKLPFVEEYRMNRNALKCLRYFLKNSMHIVL